MAAASVAVTLALARALRPTPTPPMTHDAPALAEHSAQ